MLYVAHKDDTRASEALAILKALGATTEELEGPNPYVPLESTFLFTSQTGRFTGKNLRRASSSDDATAEEVLAARGISTPHFAKKATRLVALRVRHERSDARNESLTSAMRQLCGVFPPKKKRDRLSSWRKSRRLRAEDNGFFYKTA